MKLSFLALSGLLAISPAWAQSGNKTQDVLANLLPIDQAAALSIALHCTASDPFFMGMAPNGEAFWSVRCANSRNYLVQINPDVNGSTQVLDCAVLASTTQVRCFEKMK